MSHPHTDSALVIFSGGQDSTTCLAWARKRFAHVETITFDYGQRHRIELEQARHICQSWKISQTVLPVSSLAFLSGNALTDPLRVVSASGGLGGLPSTFVPGRNALFLTLAGAFAAPRGIHHLVIGACETDYSGYPDCRLEFIQSMQQSLSLAMDFRFVIDTPLMSLTKAETFALADHLGVLDDVVEWTHTCYEGNRETRHAWGYGCGRCPACELRASGYQQYVRSRLAATTQSTHSDDAESR